MATTALGEHPLSTLSASPRRSARKHQPSRLTGNDFESVTLPTGTRVALRTSSPP